MSGSVQLARSIESQIHDGEFVEEISPVREHSWVRDIDGRTACSHCGHLLFDPAAFRLSDSLLDAITGRMAKEPTCRAAKR